MTGDPRAATPPVPGLPGPYAYLGEGSLFAGLTGAQVERLAEFARLSQYADGDVVVAGGSLGDSLYILDDGQVDVCSSDGQGREVLLTTVGERGAFFGEVALVDPGPRSATLRARGPTRLLQFSVNTLGAFFAEHPDAQLLVLRNIARTLARRLRQANVRFAAASAG